MVSRQVTVIYAVTMLLVEIGVAGLIGFITLIVSTPALHLLEPWRNDSCGEETQPKFQHR